jgi:hypothetical protein
MLALLAGTLLFPAALDRGAALLIPSDWSLFAPMLGLGVVGAVGAALVGALLSITRTTARSTVTFTSTGIREELPGVPPTVIERPWTFIEDVVALPSHVTLYCAEPMRSGQLGAAARRRHILVDRSHPQFDQLRALTEANTPHRF